MVHNVSGFENESMIKEKYSLNYLNSISDGDTDFIKDMIQTFISNVPIELYQIRQLVLKNEWNLVGAEAHRFASNLVFLELEDLRVIAIKIENLGTYQKQTEQIPELLNRLEEGCSIIIHDLKNDFSL